MHLEEREREFGGVIGGGGREEDWGRPRWLRLEQKGGESEKSRHRNERRREKVSC